MAGNPLVKRSKPDLIILYPYEWVNTTTIANHYYYLCLGEHENQQRLQSLIHKNNQRN